MLHFTPYAEDWSKLPVIVSGEGATSPTTRQPTSTGLRALYDAGRARQDGAGGCAAQADEGARVLPELEFPAPRSLELAQKLAEIAPGISPVPSSSPLDRRLWRRLSSWRQYH